MTSLFDLTPDKTDGIPLSDFIKEANGNAYIIKFIEWWYSNFNNEDYDMSINDAAKESFRHLEDYREIQPDQPEDAFPSYWAGVLLGRIVPSA